MALTLPARPSMEWLRKTAKDHLRVMRDAHPESTLAQAQLSLARQYGFPSWRALKARVGELTGATPRSDDQAVGRFLERAGTGDADAVRAAIAADPSVVSATGPHPFWGGRPQALHVAIEAGHREVFDLLLASGADVDGQNDGYDHWSPLALAVDRGRSDMQQVLLAEGAAVGLLEALLLGDDAAVDRLLRDGRPASAGGRPRLPVIRPNGGSLLAFARTTTAIDLLLGLGAETGLKDRWGATPIEAMSRLGAPGQPLVRHMRSRGIPATAAEYARLGDLATLAALADRDPAVTRSDAVLMGAVDFGHHELARWLLARGANPNARSVLGSQGSALHSAAWEGDLPMARLLVVAGADPRARDPEHGNTPAGWARVAARVTSNPRCTGVAEYLDSVTGEPED
jgi:ankyrin repeat protein